MDICWNKILEVVRFVVELSIALRNHSDVMYQPKTSHYNAAATSKASIG